MVGHFLTIVPSTSRSCSFNDSGSIVIRDLCAEDTSADETKYRDEREYDHVLIAEPCEWHVFAHHFKKSQERKRADDQKQGDKHRR